MIVFAFLLFWRHGQASAKRLMSTLKLIAQNRPQPGPEVVEAQKGARRRPACGRSGSPSLLKSKK
jgi:hypothetical protein